MSVQDSNTLEPISRYALLCNCIPLLLLTSIIVITFIFTSSFYSGFILFSLLLYMIPPLLCQIIITLLGKPEGRDLTQESREFRIWWILLQLQMVFNRITFLEEILRLVPGLYPLWLNLWGAKVNPTTYWAPGARMLDRSYIKAAYGSVVGTDALMSGHLARLEENKYLVDVARIEIGKNAIIGARVNIAPGCVIEKDETVTATTNLPPFTHYINGRRR